ncbi:hypothetical protein B0H10DRAFT_1957533 [Mycena sp. CBHHK59/15]|nr:hypothetical protein B0H10DRAFT_1957533 [Mycena sp. CBHHK59/15]
MHPLTPSSIPSCTTFLRNSEVLSIEAGRKSEMKDELATGSVDGWSTKHDAVQQVSCNIKRKVSFELFGFGFNSSWSFLRPGDSNSASHHNEGEKDVRESAHPELTVEDKVLFADLQNGVGRLNAAVKASQSRKKTAELEADPEEDTTQGF